MFYFRDIIFKDISNNTKTKMKLWKIMVIIIYLFFMR